MNDVTSITKLGDIGLFKKTIDKLLLGKHLSSKESSYLLSSAILLLRYGATGSERRRTLEFAYWIVLNYSLNTDNFRPLYDFSFELGFYPISKAIVNRNCGSFETLNDCLALAEVEDGFTEGVTLTLEQKLADESFFSASNEGFAYIAPTSFGKTERLIKAALNKKSGPRPCIIVPTKSLLAQTRDDVFKQQPQLKVITHDEMYQDEKRFIAILTQERAIRLLDTHPALSFSALFIDEAHNAFSGGDRALLISRLVREAKLRNHNARFYFFSPVISKLSNLTAISGFNVEGTVISKNMKEPRYFYLNHEGTLKAYNRFFDSFSDFSSYGDVWDCLIKRGSTKNLIFLASPKKIRGAALEFANRLPKIKTSNELNKVIDALAEHVSPMYDELICLRRGIVYLHGQMPNGIKNYLLDRAAKLNSIRYIFANSVILEGINLPFDSIYIINLRTSKSATLVNLIGRASRLNYIFGETPHLERLRPEVIFADSHWAGTRPKMENAIKTMHQLGFNDCEDSPRIKESKGQNLKLKEKERLAFEDNLIRTSMQPEDSLNLLLNRSGLHSIYENWSDAKPEIIHRLQTLTARSDDTIFDIICRFFVDGDCFVFTNSHRRISSLRNQKSYYQNYLDKKASQSLNQRLASDINYWKAKTNNSESLLFVGPSFGELNIQGAPDSRGSYINMKVKSDSELPALFLAKYKAEDDYLGFVLSRFVRVLFKTGHIDQDRYHMFIYGVTDAKCVRLVQAGVSLSLIKTLLECNLLDAIGQDNYGNIKIEKELRAFSETTDDFTAFSINQLGI